MIETQTIEIAPEEARIVLDILQARIPEREIWIFGSRVRKRARRRSDLDLAVGGSMPLTLAQRADLADDFLQSDLPYFVDIVDLASITTEFRQIIEPDFIPCSVLRHQLGDLS
jgi:predicted nucleotidyltransferase